MSTLLHYLVPPPRVASTRRGPGRPKVRTEAFYAALLADREKWAARFAARLGRPPRSDAELIESCLEDDLRKGGMRGSRGQSSEMLRRVKTLRNQLGEARRALRGCPGNPTFHGIDGLPKCDAGSLLTEQGRTT